MQTTFLLSTIPSQLEDGPLETYIRQLIKQLDSISLEINDSWNHPAKQAVMPTLRRQLGETSCALDAALYVWEIRMISMR